jgi:hypothetical protein
MVLAAASVAVTVHAHPAVRGATRTPALIAPRIPYRGTPSGITLLPYVQSVGSGAQTPLHVAP